MASGGSDDPQGRAGLPAVLHIGGAGTVASDQGDRARNQPQERVTRVLWTSGFATRVRDVKPLARYTGRVTCAILATGHDDER